MQINNKEISKILKEQEAEWGKLFFEDMEGNKHEASFETYVNESEICIASPISDIIENERTSSAETLDELTEKTPDQGTTGKTKDKFKGATDPSLSAEQVNLAYLKKLPDQHGMHSKIVQALKNMGLEGDKLDAAAQIAVLGHIEKITSAAWSIIPMYNAHKFELKTARQKWDKQSHYTVFWKPWADKGLLFRDQLRGYDPSLVQGLENWCSQSIDQRPVSHYLPPVKSVRLDREINQIDNLVGKDAARAESAARHRNLK